jgi:1-deoxy-D-xylulose-5-phosphate reductoisomerase
MDTVTEVVAEHDADGAHGTDHGHRADRTGTSLTVADVLEAEAWARARAREKAAALADQLADTIGEEQPAEARA